MPDAGGAEGCDAGMGSWIMRISRQLGGAAAIINDGSRRPTKADFSALAEDRQEGTWHGELVRYLATSAIALLADVAILMGMAQVFHYLAAATAGFVAGVLVSYFLATRWAFRRRRLAHRARAEFASYVLIGICGLGINNLTIFVGVEALSLALPWAKAFAVGLTFSFNFCARKFLLF